MTWEFADIFPALVLKKRAFDSNSSRYCRGVRNLACFGLLWSWKEGSKDLAMTRIGGMLLEKSSADYFHHQ